MAELGLKQMKRESELAVYICRKAERGAASVMVVGPSIACLSVCVDGLDTHWAETQWEGGHQND